jgi:hypothetical protein
MSTIVPYTDILEIKSELGLQQDTNGNWLLWQIPVDGEVIQHYVDQGNQQTTMKFGDLSGAGPLFFGYGKQYATKWAALRLIQTMTITWQVSGMQMGVGNITINRLPALQAAANMIIARLTEDLNNIYVQLVDVSMSFPNAYQNTSPYISTGGSLFWPLIMVLPFTQDLYTGLSVLILCTVGIVVWNLRKKIGINTLKRNVITLAKHVGLKHFIYHNKLNRSLS